MTVCCPKTAESKVQRVGSRLESSHTFTSVPKTTADTLSFDTIIGRQVVITIRNECVWMNECMYAYTGTCLAQLGEKEGRVETLMITCICQSTEWSLRRPWRMTNPLRSTESPLHVRLAGPKQLFCCRPTYDGSSSVWQSPIAAVFIASEENFRLELPADVCVRTSFYATEALKTCDAESCPDVVLSYCWPPMATDQISPVHATRASRVDSFTMGLTWRALLAYSNVRRWVASWYPNDVLRIRFWHTPSTHNPVAGTILRRHHSTEGATTQQYRAWAIGTRQRHPWEMRTLSPSDRRWTQPLLYILLNNASRSDP